MTSFELNDLFELNTAHPEVLGVGLKTNDFLEWGAGGHNLGHNTSDHLRWVGRPGFPTTNFLHLHYKSSQGGHC